MNPFAVRFITFPPRFFVCFVSEASLDSTSLSSDVLLSKPILRTPSTAFLSDSPPVAVGYERRIVAADIVLLREILGEKEVFGEEDREEGERLCVRIKPD